MFGFSLLTVIFEDSVDNYFARTRVLERLSFLQGLMPAGVTPQLGPDATGLGWVYQYYFHVDPSAKQDAGSLRSLQDFFVRYQSVTGAGTVSSASGQQVSSSSGGTRVPEPGMLGILGVSLIGLGLARRRQSRGLRPA